MNRTIWLLSMAAFLAAAMTRMTDALLPEIASEFDVAIDEAALAITAFTFAYGAFQLAYGWIGARLGPYKTAAIASGLAATGAMVSALATDLTGLAVGRFWSGMTVAAVIPMSMAFIGETVPYEQRQTVIARFLMGQVLGVVLGQAFAGLFAQIFEWRDLFWALAVGLALISLALWRELNGPNVPKFKAQSVSVNPINAYSKILAVPWARIVLLIVCIEGLLFGLYPFLAAHLAENLSTEPLMIGGVMSCFGIGGLCYITNVGRLHKKLGERGLVITGGVLLLIGYGGLSFLPNAASLALAAMIIGLGYYMLHNTLQTNATQMAPFDRSAAIALFAFGLFVSQAIGVAIGGMASTQTGYPMLFVVGAIGNLVLALAFGKAIKNKPIG